MKVLFQQGSTTAVLVKCINVFHIVHSYCRQQGSTSYQIWQMNLCDLKFLPTKHETPLLATCSGKTLYRALHYDEVPFDTIPYGGPISELKYEYRLGPLTHYDAQPCIGYVPKSH